MITCLMLVCVDCDGRSEKRVFISVVGVLCENKVMKTVVGVEFLYENKVLFYIVAFG